MFLYKTSVNKSLYNSKTCTNKDSDILVIFKVIDRYSNISQTLRVLIIDVICKSTHLEITSPQWYHL